MSCFIKPILITLSLLSLGACSMSSLEPRVMLSHGIDESAGQLPSYIVATPTATYFLDKQGGGLSSLLDKDGVDWLGFHNQKGSGHKGEYRGFPNAVHKQDGNYFHALNATTNLATSEVELNSAEHVRIVFRSENGLWQGVYDFYPDRCDFTMTQVSPGYHYWVLYEGVPNGAMDKTDFWFGSVDDNKHPIEQAHHGDLPAPEWFAFGDEQSQRMLFVVQHHDDDLADSYEYRQYMTVMGFGRLHKDKFLSSPQTFSIGFVESAERSKVGQHIEKLLSAPSQNNTNSNMLR